MAGDWIKMLTDLHEKPEVAAIGERLDLDSCEVIGRLHRIWSWFSTHSTDGVAVVSVAYLDRLVAREGFAEAMTAVGWMTQRNGSLALSNFDRHNSQSAKARALTRDRVKRHRNDSPVTSSSVGSDSSGSVEVQPEGRQIGFPDFWRAWGYKVAKGSAEKAWPRAVTLGLPATIVEAAEEFTASPSGKSAGDKCPHPATWLNARRWQDDRATWWARDSTPENGRKLRDQWVKTRDARREVATWTEEERKRVMELHRGKVSEREPFDPVRQSWEQAYARMDWDKIAVALVAVKRGEAPS